MSATKPEVEITLELFTLPVLWPTFEILMSGHVGSVISESGMVENEQGSR